MADLTTTKLAGIPATMLGTDHQGHCREPGPTSVAGGGKPLLRLLRDGIWVYGQENIEVQEGSHWAVNPMQLGRSGLLARRRAERQERDGRRDHGADVGAPGAQAGADRRQRLQGTVRLRAEVP